MPVSWGLLLVHYPLLLKNIRDLDSELGTTLTFSDGAIPSERTLQKEERH